jgi:hypothetical protein
LILLIHASKGASDSHVNSIATRDPYDECSPSVVAVGPL